MSNTTITPAVGALALAGVAVGNWPSSGFLYLTEFDSLLNDAASGSSYPRCPSLADQVIAFGGISAASAPFNGRTRVVRVHSSATCAVKIGGSAPVAKSGLGGTSRLAAGVSEYYAVHPGEAVAVITAT
jgi:hypothetical protein